MWSPELGDVDAILRLALNEDVAAGDVTTTSTVRPDLIASASLVAKQSVVLSGGAVFARAFTLVDPDAVVAMHSSDGTEVESTTIVARVVGRAWSILLAERTALNFIQRMTGVATLTRRYVDAVRGTACRIVDTRKTTPGLRALQRYAVRCGGGRNHRNDLASAVLIKENHIRCAGGIASAVRLARAAAPHTMRIECEVTNLDEVEQALIAGVDIIMLDNMDDPSVGDAVAFVAGRAIVEVSGGITLERVPILARLGVDVVSVGALTHSAPAADLSLLVDVGSARVDV